LGILSGVCPELISHRIILKICRNLMEEGGKMEKMCRQRINAKKSFVFLNKFWAFSWGFALN
jgi:hypothetical protein